MPVERSIVPIILVLFVLVGSACLVVASMPTLKVYSDNSVEVIGNYTIPSTVYGEVSFDVRAEDGKTMVSLQMSGEQTGTINTNVSLDIDFEQQIVDNIIKVIITLSLDMRDNSGWLVASTEPNIVIEVNKESLVVHTEGKVKLEAGGEATQVYAVLAMLNKPLIEQSLNQSGITWVKIERLSTSVSDSIGYIDFAVDIEIGEALEQTNTSIEEFKDALDKSSYPLSGGLEFSVTSEGMNIEFSATVEKDINDVLESIAELYSTIEETGVSEQMQYVPTPVPAPSTQSFSPIFTMTNEFCKRLEVLSSEGYVHIKPAGNGTLVVEYKTPRIVKKGATSPADTIRELYDFAMWVNEELGQYSPIPLADVTEETVKIEGEGVEVTLNGTEVSTVKFSDLPNLEATVEEQPSGIGGIGTEVIIGIVAIVIIAIAIILIMHMKK